MASKARLQCVLLLALFPPSHESSSSIPRDDGVGVSMKESDAL